MSDQNPCHCHDCTDFPEHEDTHSGCCAPIPVRLTCEAPVLPVPACDEEDVEMIYDEETERFTAVGIMFTNNCSPWLDKNGDPWKALIA